MTGNARRAMAMMVLAAGLSLAGCESKKVYPHATVHGKVTYQGKPLTYGSVMFFPIKPPEDGVLMGASGDIKPDGTYELKSQDEGGALLGEHKVVVYAVDAGPTPAPPKVKESDKDKEGAAPAATQSNLKNVLPKKYSDMTTTPLTKKVVEGDNTIDIDITD